MCLEKSCSLSSRQVVKGFGTCNTFPERYFDKSKCFYLLHYLTSDGLVFLVVTRQFPSWPATYRTFAYKFCPPIQYLQLAVSNVLCTLSFDSQMHGDLWFSVYTCREWGSELEHPGILGWWQEWGRKPAGILLTSGGHLAHLAEWLCWHLQTGKKCLETRKGGVLRI